MIHSTDLQSTDLQNLPKSEGGLGYHCWKLNCVSLIDILRVSKSSDTIPDLSSSTKPVDESSIFSDSEDEFVKDSSWQKNLDLLLAPDTSVAEGQIVLSDWLSSGDEIPESVRTSLRECKVSK